MNKIIFETLPSTNSYLKDNYNNHNNLDVIIAKTQTNGRGRFDRKWLSNEDISLSILFKGSDYNHAIISSLAVLYTLRDLNIEASIKWPNDIYVLGMKISGILIESIYESNNKACDIVGIGINMDECIEYKSIGINNLVSTNKEYVIDKLLHNYKDLLTKDYLFIKDEYIKNNMVINKDVIYKDIKYKVLGISDEFKLILKHNNKIIEVSTDEIKLSI